MRASSHGRKAKITVTLSPDVIRRLDALVEAPDARSRSQLVEEALRRWIEDRARRELESQTEEYYRSLSQAEQAENKEWTAIAAESATQLWNQ